MMTLAAYARERVRLEVFAPAIVLLTFTALWIAGVTEPTLATIATALALMTTLVLQFRLWDDLADRDTDRIAHPDRVLVVSDPAPFRRALAVLIGLAAGLGYAIGGVIGLAAVVAIDLGALVLYRVVRPRLSPTVWPLVLVATKYSALVTLVAMTTAAPPIVSLVAGCALTSIAACVFELAHARPSSAGVPS